MQITALERAVALECDAALPVLRHRGLVVLPWAPRDLVAVGRLAALLDELVELGGAVVAHPDRAGQAGVAGPLELAPDRGRAPLRRRPVDQPQVDRVDAERAQAL